MKFLLVTFILMFCLSFSHSEEDVSNAIVASDTSIETSSPSEAPLPSSLRKQESLNESQYASIEETSDENPDGADDHPAVPDTQEQPASSEEEEPLKVSQKEAVFEELSEEETLMRFFIEEVIPAFGGFQNILFSQKPSFEIHLTSAGMQIRHCSFQLQLKQLRAVRYNLANIGIYEFQSNAEIGDPRMLLVQLSCGETDYATNKKKFNIRFFVQDEEEKPSYYSLKIKMMDKEQFDMKLWSIQLNIEIETVENILISDSFGHVEILPYESRFLKFFEEDKAYAKVLEEEDNPPEDNEPVKNMYDIPQSVWAEIQGVSEAHPEDDPLMPLTKMNIEQIITLQGVAEISLPVYKDGVKRDIRVEMPVSGSVFSSEEGGMIPVIDISTKK